VGTPLLRGPRSNRAPVAAFNPPLHSLWARVLSPMNIQNFISTLLGLGFEPKDLTFIQISLRSLIVFTVALAMVRLGNRRFLARLSAVDAILGFILASMLARAVNGSAAFFPTLGGGFVLVFIHRLLAALAFRYERIGLLVKGRADILVENGKCNQRTMEQQKISEADLLEEARLNGQVSELSQIRCATIERNGEVSIIPAH
jgi:uncharacterized membrane protein YcaP (DUF421 family)